MGQKKIVVWMRDNWILSTFLLSLAANILSTILFAMIKGVTLKMTYDVFLVVLPWVVPVILGFLLVKQRWKTLKLKYEKLAKLTKLPKTFDRAITVERSPDWGSDPIIIANRYGKFPHLRFDMRVINRTYFLYGAEEAKLKCFCSNKEVLDKEGTWDNKTKKSETFAWVSILPIWGQGDGKIMFHVPIKKLYDDMTTWKLAGTVKYRSKEPLIDNNQYANPEIDIELEYVLSEKQISELKKEVDKALGEVILC
jgi:hypothetical protein